ncbi:hypothetical protein PsorP6_013155 [Peronosclerospora sorghi]|uniref:Uncharacterized protein n=1 Tax=Peronosclerospora sorghi TaxID=230839 RepID=A0ACC0WFJ9_9STRA|nr:hypothetical protein PsorP6_013155 [Peronosclerospora sorghi]
MHLRIEEEKKIGKERDSMLKGSDDGERETVVAVGLASPMIGLTHRLDYCSVAWHATAQTDYEEISGPK